MAKKQRKYIKIRGASEHNLKCIDIAISKKVAAEEMEFTKDPESMSRKELEKLIADIQKKMQKAATELNFEAAAEYRDKMISLKNMLRDLSET